MTVGHQPQTKSFDTHDADFVSWYSALSRGQDARRATLSIIRNHLPRQGQEGGGEDPPQPHPPPRHKAFHSYVNSRPDVDWNTCGQAAIASIADYHGKDPYHLGRDASGHWRDGEIIDAIKAGGFGPDEPFGWGTSGGRIAAALNSYGLYSTVSSSGVLFTGWESQWNALLQSVYYFHQPTPVLVELETLGGPQFTAHWPVVFQMDYSPNGMILHLGNCSWAEKVSEDKFLEAWACRHLPPGFNHCGVFCTSS